jgi:cytochrome P450
MNFFSEETRRNPYPMYDQLRSYSPVLHDPTTNMWMVFDYESVKRAVSDHETFSSSLADTANRHTPDWLIFQDAPRHTRLRAIIMQAFTPRSITSLETRIGDLSRTLLDQAIERGAAHGCEIDLATDYSVPLPMMVIAEMIGIPLADWPLFRNWSDVILKLSLTISDGAESQAALREFAAMKAEVSDYLRGLVDQRRSHPRDDLLTRLVEAEVEGDRLTHEEIVAFFQLLLVGGNETTANLINNAILCLIEDPDQLARVRAEPNLLPSTIEEVLRYRAPVQWVLRATRRDVEVHGQTIPAGKIVLAMIGSANRDAKQFNDADRFDISRDPNPHVTFGHGVHFCLGAPLSRLEARIALTDLIERLSGFELASDQPWEPREALHVHGPTRLPIRFGLACAAP